MQENVKNFPAHQHSGNAICNPHAKWAYNRTVFHCCTIRPTETERKFPGNMGKSACPHAA
eukprot:2167791-Prymnesium_polylepis.2